jgi:hypothetical protein
VAVVDRRADHVDAVEAHQYEALFLEFHVHVAVANVVAAVRLPELIVAATRLQAVTVDVEADA